MTCVGCFSVKWHARSVPSYQLACKCCCNPPVTFFVLSPTEISNWKRHGLSWEVCGGGREWKWETLGVLKSYAPLLTQCHCRCVSKNNSENHKLMDSEWSSFWNREKHNCDLWVFGKHATHPIVTLSLNLLKMPTLTIKCSKDEKHTTLPKLAL